MVRALGIFLLLLGLLAPAFGWDDPNHSNSVIILDFDSDADPSPDTSCLSTNDANMGGGTYDPQWEAPVNSMGSSLMFHDDRLTIPGHASFQARSNFTLSVWFRAVWPVANIMTIVGRGGAVSNGFGVLVLTNGTVRVYRNGTTQAWNPGVLDKSNLWQHLGFIHRGSGNTLEYYHNGNYQDSTSFVFNANGSTLDMTFGYWLAEVRLLNNARIAKFAMYTNAISAAEMNDLFWANATNYGWSVYDYYNRQEWSNTIAVANANYAATNSNPFLSEMYHNASYLRTGVLTGPHDGVGRTTFQSNGTNGWRQFDVWNDYFRVKVPEYPQAFTWWAKTNAVWRHYAEIQGEKFRDGVLFDFDNVYYQWDSANSELAWGVGTNGQRFGPSIDKIRVYATNFTATMLSNLYYETRPRFRPTEERGVLIEF